MLRDPSGELHASRYPSRYRFCALSVRSDARFRLRGREASHPSQRDGDEPDLRDDVEVGEHEGLRLREEQADAAGYLA